MKNQIDTSFSDENSTIIYLLSCIVDLLKMQYVTSPRKQYLDSADLKCLLNISDSTLYRLRKNNKIPIVKLGGKIYCPTSFFDNLEEGQ